MKKIIFCLSFVLFSYSVNANDGSYYIDGNQLIPMTETSISVKKEILDIKRNLKNDRQVDVSVYYEFYNSGEAKTLTVGFEAHSPFGDIGIDPRNEEHPNMYKFTVDMNGQKLPYQVAIVSDSVYFQNGKFKSLSPAEVEENTGEGWADYMYVYHFQANFKKGLNIVKHTYTCDLSGSVMAEYSFGYILSAAMRWDNKQIDDFTLNINMGADQLINIPQTFFDNTNEWVMTGMGRKRDTDDSYYYSEDGNPPLTSEFYIKSGYLIFQKKNFRPKGELHIYSPRPYVDLGSFDYQETTYITSDINSLYFDETSSVINEISAKVLRNLPFARRGYIFTTPELQKYYENQIWYFPDPSYKSDISKLSIDEQKWVQFWSK